MKIVADDKIPFLKGVFEPYARVVYAPGGEIGKNELMTADALLIRTRTRCTPELLEGTPVKFIATATIGFDHISPELRVPWSNAPGCNSGSVAQYVISALLRLDDLPLRGRVLSVIGAGHVGSKVAAAGRAMGMTVLVNDPPRAEREGPEGFVPLDEAVERADFLSFHVPLERLGKHATFHLADRELLARMKPGAVLLNTSRGEVADSAALKEVLYSGRIRAVLDVWENEPDPDPELLELAAFATAHIAGYSTDGKANGTAAAVRAVARALNIPELIRFEVQDIPVPENSTIILPSGIPLKEALQLACEAGYDIRNDDRRLRAAPGSFEALRGNYPLRREPGAFVVENAPGCLKKLGFLVKSEVPLYWDDDRIRGEVSGEGAVLVNHSPERISCVLTASEMVRRIRKKGRTESDFVWLENQQLNLVFQPFERVVLDFLTKEP